MAWLTGLADKAEDLLNKIDKNTAAVLNKEKHETCQVPLTDVTWVPSSQSSFDNDVTTRSSNLESSKQLKHPLSVSNLKSLTPSAGDSHNEDLLMYLNMPTASPKEVITESTTSPPTPSSLLVEHPTDNTDSVSEFSVHSGRSSPEFICTINVDNEEKNDTTDTKVDSIKPESMKVGKLLDSSANNCSEKYLKTTEKNWKEENELLEKQAIDHQKQILLLNEKLRSLEVEKLQMTKQTTDLQTALDRSRLELLSTRSELEQHRARALRILQDKEKLIAELKSNVSSGVDDTTLMELNQLRQERDTLREENQQTHEQLILVREELSNADLNLEKIRQKSMEENIKVQEILAAERRKRLDAEEIASLHSEEIRSLKDELVRQRNNFTIQLQKQDKEMSRLRLQLSASSTPSSEVESRLTSLTQTLVLKQQALESLTTERNALRLQLEKLEHEFRTAIGNSRRNVSYNNINDTDDAKAQVPTFLMETPFDTGVTRRVKRAYSSLDAISVRTGVFLRRYPLARILVLIYMALLQFWVLVVLLSQSPEAH